MSRFPDANEEERRLWDAVCVAVARSGNCSNQTAPARWADAALQYRRDSFGERPERDKEGDR